MRTEIWLERDDKDKYFYHLRMYVFRDNGNTTIYYIVSFHQDSLSDMGRDLNNMDFHKYRRKDYK